MENNYYSKIEYPRELEENTANLWLEQGTIKIEDYGSENTYYIDQFDNRFFCKNYPQAWKLP